MTFAELAFDTDSCPFPEIATIDVRSIPHVGRQPLLFAAFSRLEPGQAFRLVNDHDPVPVGVRLQTAYPGQVAWEYLEEGPAVWQVRIGKQPRAGDDWQNDGRDPAGAGMDG